MGLDKILKVGSTAFVNKILEALALNTKAIDEDKLISAINEIAPKVVSAPVISGSDLIVEVTSTTATILWVTDKKSNSLVAYAKEGSFVATRLEPYAQVVGNVDESVSEHSVTLLNLEPSTQYHFEVRSKSSLGDWSKSGDKTFTTRSLTPEIQDFQFQQIKEAEAVVSWQTTLPTITTITVTDTKTGERKVQQEISYIKEHVFTVKNLLPASTYNLQIASIDEQGNQATSPIVPFSTIVSTEPPNIANIRVATSLIPGKIEKVQSIVTWDTNKPSTSRIFYEEGVSSSAELSKSTVADESLVLEHVVITTNFKPGKVYRFRVESIDSIGNATYSKDYTILTPRPKQTVIDLIFTNFEQTFGFLKGLNK